MKQLLTIAALLVFSFTSQAASERWRGFAATANPVILIHQVQDGTNLTETIYLPQSNGNFVKTAVENRIISFSDVVYQLENGMDLTIPSGTDLSSEPELRNAGDTKGIILKEVKIAPELLAKAKAFAQSCESAF